MPLLYIINTDGEPDIITKIIDMENTETIYKVGDKVWSPTFGWGKVVEVDMNSDPYPVRVKYEKRANEGFTLDGRYLPDCPISLFFTEQQYSVERPAWQPKQGEWCWFWDDSKFKNATLARFEAMCEDLFMTDSRSTWNHCAPFVGELPPHLKE